MHVIDRLFAIVLGALLFPSLAAAESFDAFHPDQQNRKIALEAYEKGDTTKAAVHFRRAARFADKPSQLALALMYADGVGVAKDPALAYAWADLAAERGYPDFLAIRERYWAALDEAAQVRAKAAGEKLYEEFRDARAKKRLEMQLRRGLSQKTGSRTGSGTATPATAQLDTSARAAMIAATSTSGLNAARDGVSDGQVTQHQLSTLVQIVGSVSAQSGIGYYDDANWKPKQYWAYQDALWSKLDGVVEVKSIKRDGR
jgi:hypothetical protein